jgi:hypothetical protein
MSDEIIENEVIENEVEESGEELDLSSEESSEGSEVGEMSASDQAELKDAIEEAIEEGATEEEVQDMIKTFTLKVNGKEVVKKIDLNDEESIKRELQMAHAGRGAMQRAKELEKAYEEALEELKSDPFSVLKQLGTDVDELTKGYLQKQIEEMKKSPEELAQEKYERELAEAREQERKYKEELDRIRYEQVMAEENAKLEDEISGALDAYEQLPDNPMVRQKIAETMMWAMENGYDDVSAKDVLPTVEKELIKQQEQFFSSMPTQFIEKFLGKSNIEKMRENRLAKAKAAPKKPKVTETSDKPLKEKEERKKVRAKDFFKNLGS